MVNSFGFQYHISVGSLDIAVDTGSETLVYTLDADASKFFGLVLPYEFSSVMLKQPFDGNTNYMNIDNLIWGMKPYSSHWIAQGRSTYSQAMPSKIAHDTEQHEVRCCSDTEITGWVQNAGCSVWAESDILGDCYENRTYDESVAICAMAGARLCTVEELEADCTANTGCYHDYDLIWSSTEA